MRRPVDYRRHGGRPLEPPQRLEGVATPRKSCPVQPPRRPPTPPTTCAPHPRVTRRPRRWQRPLWAPPDTRTHHQPHRPGPWPLRRQRQQRQRQHRSLLRPRRRCTRCLRGQQRNRRRPRPRGGLRTCSCTSPQHPLCRLRCLHCPRAVGRRRPRRTVAIATASRVQCRPLFPMRSHVQTPLWHALHASSASRRREAGFLVPALAALPEGIDRTFKFTPTHRCWTLLACCLVAPCVREGAPPCCMCGALCRCKLSTCMFVLRGPSSIRAV